MVGVDALSLHATGDGVPRTKTTAVAAPHVTEMSRPALRIRCICADGRITK
jgi:hypothetical protein